MTAQPDLRAWVQRCVAHRSPVEPVADRDADRIAGGLLGALAGEDRSLGGWGPLSSALIDLIQHYADPGTAGVPVGLAHRHRGAPGPAWLLPTVIDARDRRQVLAEGLELALAGGIQRYALGDCVAYLDLAYDTLTGQLAPATLHADLRLCGEVCTDAVAVGRWALATGADVATIVGRVGSWTTPGVVSASCGLAGLHRGIAAIADSWSASQRSSTTRELVGQR